MPDEAHLRLGRSVELELVVPQSQSRATRRWPRRDAPGDLEVRREAARTSWWARTRSAGGGAVIGGSRGGGDRSRAGHSAHLVLRGPQEMGQQEGVRDGTDAARHGREADATVATEPMSTSPTIGPHDVDPDIHHHGTRLSI